MISEYREFMPKEILSPFANRDDNGVQLPNIRKSLLKTRAEGFTEICYMVSLLMKDDAYSCAGRICF